VKVDRSGFSNSGFLGTLALSLAGPIKLCPQHPRPIIFPPSLLTSCPCPPGPRTPFDSDLEPALSNLTSHLVLLEKLKPSQFRTSVPFLQRAPYRVPRYHEIKATWQIFGTDHGFPSPMLRQPRMPANASFEEITRIYSFSMTPQPCIRSGAAGLAEHLSPTFHGIGKHVQGLDGVLPPDAGIGDADAVLEALLALLGDLLAACTRVRRIPKRQGQATTHPR
jgi:hypothetical protein